MTTIKTKPTDEYGSKFIADEELFNEIVDAADKGKMSLIWDEQVVHIEKDHKYGKGDRQIEVRVA